MKTILKISFIIGFLVIGCFAYSQPGGTSQMNSGSKYPVPYKLGPKPRDGVFDRIHTEDKVPIPFSHLRQSDVIYSKKVWQKIDLREKINQSFYYPNLPRNIQCNPGSTTPGKVSTVNAKNNLKRFVDVLIDAVLLGEINAYKTANPTNPLDLDDEFNYILTAAELRDLMDGNSQCDDRFDANDVKEILIKEVWYFDKQRSVMDVRILGICPVWEYVPSSSFSAFQSAQAQAASSGGKIVKSNFYKRKAMFWVYFPQARYVLAKAEVFNRKNGVERRTYDDIFYKRMFSSYIYKEENVYDRTISKYASGMDALLESERIKADLFELENEMWEF